MSFFVNMAVVLSLFLSVYLGRYNGDRTFRLYHFDQFISIICSVSKDMIRIEIIDHVACRNHIVNIASGNMDTKRVF